jgi:hypothetical protein
MKGRSVPRLNLSNGSQASPRGNLSNATVAAKDQTRSPLTASPNKTVSKETYIQSMTPRSQFPVTCSLVVEVDNQTLLSAEGLQALGRSITAISSCSTYASALNTAEQQLRTLMMHSVLLVSSRAAPHVVSCVVGEGVVECATSARVYRACDRVDAFAVVGGEAVALQCCSAARYPAHQVSGFCNSFPA